MAQGPAVLGAPRCLVNISSWLSVQHSISFALETGEFPPFNDSYDYSRFLTLNYSVRESDIEELEAKLSLGYATVLPHVQQG